MEVYEPCSHTEKYSQNWTTLTLILRFLDDLVETFANTPRSIIENPSVITVQKNVLAKPNFSNAFQWKYRSTELVLFNFPRF